MRRGTTPTLVINVNGASLAEMEMIFVTLRQDNLTIEKSGTDLNIAENQIRITLNQEDTLSLDARGRVDIQIRCKTKLGTVVASNIKSLSVDDVLKEGVI